MDSPDNRPELYLVISFGALTVLPILFILRFLDDNRLTSWQWIFTDGGVGNLYLFIIPAILLAYFFARFDLPEHFPSLFLFLVSFTVSASLWSVPEVILDASRYFIQAKYLAQKGPHYFWQEWGKTIGAWTDLPLVPFLYGMLFKLFGEARIFVQIFNSMLFSLTAVLVCRVGTLLWDDKTGFHAGLLFLAIPYLPTQVPLLLVDIATMFFLVLAIYTYLLALIRGGTLRCCSSGAAIFLAFFSKYSTWLMLGILPLITLVHLDKNHTRIMQRSIFIALLAVLSVSTIFLLKIEVFVEQIHLLRTYQAEGLKRWQEGYISSFFFQIYPFVSLAALWGAIRAIMKKEYRFLVAAWFAIFVFLLQVKRMRYMVPLLPLLPLMAAYGLQDIQDERLKRFACYVCLLSSLVILFAAYKPFLQRTSMNNLLEAGRYLDTLPEKSFSVLCLEQHESSGSTYAALPILDLHTRKNLRSQTQWPAITEHPDFLQTSLRFSWELPQPSFYMPVVPNGTKPRVVIASQDLEELPSIPGITTKFSPLKKFNKQTGVFRYKTLVTILPP